MSSSETAMIDTVTKANRYLSGLGGKVEFGEAIRRVQANSSAAIVDKLGALDRFVRGEALASPSPELALIGDVVKHAPSSSEVGKAIASANTALTDAKDLANHLRGGLPSDLGYSALLLLVATIVASIWLIEIAPTFGELFGSWGADIPLISQTLIDLPWLIFAGIGFLASILIGIFLSVRQLSPRLETIAPLASHWLPLLLGGEFRRAYESWRTLTVSRAWAAGGVAPLEAVRRAGEVLATTPDVRAELESAVMLASEFESSESELDYQLKGSVERLRHAVEWRRALALRFLQVSTAVLVGVIVLALYLPIFKMGAVV